MSQVRSLPARALDRCSQCSLSGVNCEVAMHCETVLVRHQRLGNWTVQEARLHSAYASNSCTFAHICATQIRSLSTRPGAPRGHCLNRTQPQE